MQYCLSKVIDYYNIATTLQKTQVKIEVPANITSGGEWRRGFGRQGNGGAAGEYNWRTSRAGTPRQPSIRIEVNVRRRRRRNAHRATDATLPKADTPAPKGQG